MWLDCSVLIREVSSSQSVLYKEVPLYRYQEGRHGVSRGRNNTTHATQTQQPTASATGCGDDTCSNATQFDILETTAILMCDIT